MKKRFFSFIAMLAVLFVFTTSTMAQTLRSGGKIGKTTQTNSQEFIGPLVTPNDPQVDLASAGQLRLFEFWDKQSSLPVNVIIIGNGIDQNHPDLAGKVVGGFDFITNQPIIPTPEGAHDTFVAGIISATGQNGMYTAGVRWQGVRFYSFKVLQLVNGRLTGDSLNLISAVRKATDIARQTGLPTVIHISVDAPASAIPFQESAEMKNALGETKKIPNIINVCYAGNRTSDASGTYPANLSGEVDSQGNVLDNVLVVGAVDFRDQMTAQSNFGAKVDFFASGFGVKSIIPLSTPSSIGVSGVDIGAGTSFASPWATGVAAEILSRGRSGFSTINFINGNVRRVSGLNCKTGGILDATAALNAATVSPLGSAPIVQTLTATNVTQTSIILNGAVNPNAFSTFYWFDYGTTNELGNNTSSQSVGSGNSSVNVSQSLTGLTPNTTYYFRVVAQNQFGTSRGEILNFQTGLQTTNNPPKVSINPFDTLVEGRKVLTANAVDPDGDQIVSGTWFFDDGSQSGVVPPRFEVDHNFVAAIGGGRHYAVELHVKDARGAEGIGHYEFTIVDSTGLGAKYSKSDKFLRIVATSSSNSPTAPTGPRLEVTVPDGRKITLKRKPDGSYRKRISLDLNEGFYQIILSSDYGGSATANIEFVP